MKTRTLIFVLLVTTCLYSTIINVPGDQPTIQAGIDVAADTDTVLVVEGTYFENVDFIGKAITVASNFIIDGDELHIENTIINGSQATNPDFGSCARFMTGEDTTSVITGFTLTGGSGCYASPPDDNTGGGIFCDNSSPKIVSNIVTNNNSEFSGGIVVFGVCSPILRNNIISNNTATFNTGGLTVIWGNDTSCTTITNCQVTGNSAGWWGGGVHVVSASVKLLNSSITNNSAGIDGGGLGIVDAYIVNVIDCSIENNQASSWGGGVYCDNSNPEFSNCIIHQNEAEIYGGGMMFEQSTPIVNNCTISNNDAEKEAGISFFNSSGTVEDCRITDNLASLWCGGLMCYNSEVNIINSEFVGNSALNGGGLYIQLSDTNIDSCMFTQNTSNDNGGAIRIIENSNPSFNRCIIYNNSAINGGGIASYQSSPEIKNCTFYENEANGGYGGGISCVNSNLDLINSNISGSTDGGGIGFYEPDNINVEFSNFYNNTDGDFVDDVPPDLGIITTVNTNGDPCDEFMNIFLDPLFVDPGNDDFCLTEFSPCIDAGDPLSPPDPDGSIVDIGRYYYDPVGIEENLIVQTEDYLHQNYPNPFNPITTISYQLPEESRVELVIYNVKGQKVKQLVSDQRSTGQHSIVWNGKDDNNKPVSSGIYLYKMKTDNFEKTRKMILMK